MANTQQSRGETTNALASTKQSEVAALMAAIDGEVDAAIQGPQGLAQGRAWHKAMTKRMMDISKRYVGRMRALAGDPPSCIS